MTCAVLVTAAALWVAGAAGAVVGIATLLLVQANRR